DLEHRNTAVRIDLGEKLGRARFTFHDVIFASLNRHAGQRRGKPHLVAISGRGIFVEDQALAHATSNTIFPICLPDSMRACASAAWLNGKVLSITGFSRPPST